MRLDQKEGAFGPVDALTAMEKARKEALAPLFGEIRSIMGDPADYSKYEVSFNRKDPVSNSHAESVIKHKKYLKSLHYVVIEEEDRVAVSFDPSDIDLPDPKNAPVDQDIMEKMIEKNGDDALAIVKEHKDRYDIPLKQAKGDYDKMKADLKDRGLID